MLVDRMRSADDGQEPIDGAGDRECECRAVMGMVLVDTSMKEADKQSDVAVA